MDNRKIKKYISKLPKNIQSKIGSKLGSGLEGIVYSYGKTQVIKIATSTEKVKGEGYNLKHSLNILKHLKEDQIPYVVGIKNYGVISNEDEIYYIICDKLQKLSPSEENFISDILVSDWEIHTESISNSRLKKHSNLISFLKHMTDLSYDKNFKFEFRDLHYGNIMKTKDGNYKIIDFGFFELKRRWK